MLRQMSRARAGLALAAALAVAVALLIVTFGGGGSKRHGAAAAAAAQPYGPPALARYSEASPHVASVLRWYGVQGGVQGAPPTPPPSLPPLQASTFRGPVAEYRAFSVRQLGAMETQVSRLQGALAAGDRAGAQRAWRAAFANYRTLGAVYLEGDVATLNAAIDGNPGGLRGGTSSPKFTGLHRIEFGLWTGAPLASLQPFARRLATDVAKMRRLLPRVQIAAIDYATRAHEILEDAVRDLLSGTDVPWSGEGVLGTNAGVAATSEIVKTLAPLLQNREGVLPVVRSELARLRLTLTALTAAHGGIVPTNSQLTQEQSERLNASIGQALEALAQIPGALETSKPPATPAIPKTAERTDP